MAPRTPRQHGAKIGDLTLNRAFVFVKPHAVSDKVKTLVREQLTARGIVISVEGAIGASAIDKDMLIDKHYYAIASKATLLKPDKLPVPVDKFKASFGLEWSEALAGGLALNARDACEQFGVDSNGLFELWNKAKDAGDLVKFSGGFYCAKLQPPGQGTFYVFNGFFMQMRNKYVAPGASIHYFVVEWSQIDLSWADFRSKVLGPTDPGLAPSDSIRGMIFAQWKELQLPDKPNISDNGVHASASPVEGMFERLNWLGRGLHEDPFGQQLLENDVSPALIEEWRRDPQVSVETQIHRLTRH